ncbi:MAG: hypothetical protein EBT38_05025, partial [Acidimicrobiia bacterium]|nr:hypothetical protein [Acidimicrobiia bacterium]
MTYTPYTLLLASPPQMSRLVKYEPGTVVVVVEVEVDDVVDDDVVVSGGLQLGRVNVTIAECGVTFWLL